MASESNIEKVIDRLTKKSLDEGELVLRSIATYRFPYMTDEAFLNSPNYDSIVKLRINEITVMAGEKSIKELHIRAPFEIVTTIPIGEEKKYIIPSLGIGGRAFSGSLVRLYFDPTHKDVVESLKIWKARQMAHECNHVARYQVKKMGKTLLDAIIAEGLATYQEEFFGGEYMPTPWGNKLTPEEVATEWEKAKRELDNTAYNHPAWFFGVGGQHPIWTAYSLGNEIIRAYVKKHPQLKMSRLIKTDSKIILRKSSVEKTGIHHTKHHLPIIP